MFLEVRVKVELMEGSFDLLVGVVVARPGEVEIAKVGFDGRLDEGFMMELIEVERIEVFIGISRIVVLFSVEPVEADFVKVEVNAGLVERRIV